MVKPAEGSMEAMAPDLESLEAFISLSERSGGARRWCRVLKRHVEAFHLVSRTKNSDSTEANSIGSLNSYLFFASRLFLHR